METGFAHGTDDNYKKFNFPCFKVSLSELLRMFAGNKTISFIKLWRTEGDDCCRSKNYYLENQVVKINFSRELSAVWLDGLSTTPS